jgi:chromosomal replication initiation ATPase DnaA
VPLDLGLRERAPATAPALDAEQLSFDWALPVALGPQDFFVSQSNADAHALLAGGLRWPGGKLALVGPEGSGKTHLARVWAARVGALRLDAADVPADLVLPPDGAAVVVEDLERLPEASEAALFHLHNHLGATDGRLLLTARRAPSRWLIRLPDLLSRMQATAVARIEPPDDALVEALLVKQFADRQMHPAPDAIFAVARRVERSHAGIARAVALLDRAALSEGRAVTAALARRVLEDEP